MKKTIGLWIVLCLVCWAVTGCASANKNLVAADTAIHTALAALDDKEGAFCKANAEKFTQQCADLNPLIKSLLVAGDTFNRGVANQTPSGLLDLASAGTKVYEELKKLPSSATAEMYADLAKALAAAAGLAKGGA